MSPFRALLLALLLALGACCPAPANPVGLEPSGLETAFVATVLSTGADGLWVRLASGETLRVVPDAGRSAALAPGSRIYVRGVLERGYVSASGLEPLSAR